MDALPQRIAQLSPAQRRLLEARLKARRGERSSASADVSVHEAGQRRHPASFAQRRLWLVDRLVAGSPVYNNAHAIHLRGPLDARALVDCLDAIVQRHDVLRTRFEPPTTGDDAKGPQAVVDPNLKFEISKSDLTRLPETDRAAEADRRSIEFCRRPFDLAAGPLVRAMLVRLGDTEHRLIIGIHHIISDRWSVGILLKELAELYTARLECRVANLSALPLTYGEYAARQQAGADDPDLRAQLDHWRTTLAELPPPLELPADHSRPQSQSYRGAMHRFEIAPELAETVARVGRAHRATSFMTYLAAFDVLLHRYASQTDLIVGTPLACRQGVDVESLIGLFVNLLPVRTKLDASAPFIDVLARIRAASLDLLAHQSVPFDRLVDHLRIDRDPSRPPLVGVAFNFHNVPPGVTRIGALELELEDLDLGVARFDLMLTLRPEPSGRGYWAAFEFSRDLFEPATIARMAAHFLTLLRAVAADPNQPISDLPLMDESEAALLRRWGGAGAFSADREGEAPAEPGVASKPRLGGSLALPVAGNAPDCCAHELFERQARLTPDAGALVCGRDRLTYGELNRRANRLAWRLRAIGVGPEALVALCLRRTARLPVAMLAVLKAGGAYVPLDPNYPAPRLAYMLDDSRAPILLTEHELAGLLPSDPGRRLFCWEDESEEVDGERADDPPPLAGLSNLAYVIYTSGSTGRPKGVAIEHRGPAALLDWAARALPDDHVAGMLFSTSVCFDLSVFELLVPLARGGKIVLVPNVLELSACPAAAEVTFINTVPSAMAELARAGGVPRSVRAVGLAGEALPAALARRCYQIADVEAVYNLYGPTEDTVYSTACVVARDGAGAPPIGNPIGGTRAYILDAARRPVPIGIPGELYLGGPKLARGYLHRPDLTAERFIPDPFGSAGDRLYRTGDLCRWSADGSIHYLGRIDHQIKLRGFRIELGEIESALAAHPVVRQSVAIATGEGGDARLIAYWVAESGVSIPGEGELRAHLSAQLPAYMVPAALVRLDAMPLTPNGKIDRKALPAPAAQAEASAASARERRSPRHETEIELLRIWRKLLRVDDISIDDSFFHLGGHSLLAVQLMHEIKRQFGRPLPLGRLFTAPTIAKLAAALDAGETASLLDEHVVQLRPPGDGGSRPPLFCIPGAGGHGFSFLALARRAEEGQAVYGLHFRGVEMPRAAHERVEEMAAAFLAEVRRVQPAGPYRFVGYSFGGLVAYEMACQLAAAGERTELLGLFDTFAPGARDVRPFHRRLPVHARKLMDRGWRSALNYLRERATHRVRGNRTTTVTTPDQPEDGSPLFEAIRRVRDACDRAYLIYRPRPYHGPVTLFRAIDRPAQYAFLNDPVTNGWSPLLAPGLTIHDVPGTHYTMLQEPNVGGIAAVLNAMK
jgi:amino acid adenylation domain-containing protein